MRAIPDMTPIWLWSVAVFSLLVSGSCVVFIAVDVRRRPQAMWIMNVVWPLTALWAGPLAVWGYLRWGRDGAAAVMQASKAHGEEPPNRKQPFGVLTAKAATHCGSGCMLGDVVAEALFVVAPITVLGRHIFGAWIYDFVLAYAFGIVFQYFTIQPMRHMARGRGLLAAVKADTASLVAWQLGMYGWMAVATFAIFGHELSKANPVFWLMMQIAMMFGFLTAFPVNWWLLRHGVKETM